MHEFKEAPRRPAEQGRKPEKTLVQFGHAEPPKKEILKVSGETSKEGADLFIRAGI